MEWIAEAAWLGHAGILLLIVAVLTEQEPRRSILLAIAALLGVAASIFVIDRPSYALLFSLLIVAMLLRYALREHRRVDVHFSSEESQLRSLHLGGIDPAMARRLIDEGHWIDGQREEILVQQGQAAPCLFFIASGAAEVSRDGVGVGHCAAGDLVGEATVMDGGGATATVRLATGARLWFIPAERLRAFIAANPQVRSVLQDRFAEALRTKLGDANARAARAG
ncbi:MAG: cyclic nucleotide-binding domain-containing protein [Sphingopyxis sp.]|nr:cyclic nucleotide-binding domain-containing protein [Sphingopyxis sp.]